MNYGNVDLLFTGVQLQINFIIILNRKIDYNPKAVVDVLDNEEGHKRFIKSLIHSLNPITKRAVEWAVVWGRWFFILTNAGTVVFAFIDFIVFVHFIIIK